MSIVAPGQTLRMERGGALLMVEDRLGEGSQGVVHRVRLGGAPFAVKWFRDAGDEEMRKSVTALIQRGRPPHPAFVWPIDLVSSDRAEGFGYVMPLLESRFISLAQLLNRPDPPSLRTSAVIGRKLVDAFAALHSSGLCYRDISFGNLRVDPEAREVAIIDNDNVGIDGAESLVKGTGPFMAPEILRDEALPSTVTDLHSLAVLLFYLFMHGHPLLGARADQSYTWDGAGHVPDTEVMLRNIGYRPLFIFDPEDQSNPPVPGDRTLLWWSLYPRECRRVFTQAFTRGLHDASLSGRVIEGTWRRALLRMHDSVAQCPSCGAAVIYDAEQPGQQCWRCFSHLPAPATLWAPGGNLVLSGGAAVTRHHLFRDREHHAMCATVEPHPGRPGQVVLRNLTERTWRVVPDGEGPKLVTPSQRLAVRPMTIDFGGVQARIS